MTFLNINWLKMRKKKLPLYSNILETRKTRKDKHTFFIVNFIIKKNILNSRSAKLQKCLAELLQEKNNNSVNLLACTDNKKTEKLLQEQAGQNVSQPLNHSKTHLIALTCRKFYT